MKAPVKLCTIASLLVITLLSTPRPKASSMCHLGNKIYGEPCTVGAPCQGDNCGKSSVTAVAEGTGYQCFTEGFYRPGEGGCVAAWWDQGEGYDEDCCGEIGK